MEFVTVTAVKSGNFNKFSSDLFIFSALSLALGVLAIEVDGF